MFYTEQFAIFLSSWLVICLKISVALKRRAYGELLSAQVSRHIVNHSDDRLPNDNRYIVVWSGEVDLADKSIRKSSEVMKNDEYLGIPLTERAYRTLKELLMVPCVTGHVFHDKGKPLYDRQVRRAFERVLKTAGITNFHIHDLRHTFASYLRQAGVDLHTIGTLLGHKDMRMTKRYTHLNVESLRAAVEKLETTTKLLQQRRAAGVQSS